MICVWSIGGAASGPRCETRLDPVFGRYWRRAGRPMSRDRSRLGTWPYPLISVPQEWLQTGYRGGVGVHCGSRGSWPLPAGGCDIPRVPAAVEWPCLERAGVSCRVDQQITPTMCLEQAHWPDGASLIEPAVPPASRFGAGSPWSLLAARGCDSQLPPPVR